MPPKKKESKAANGEVVEGEDPVQLWKNYSSFCRYSSYPSDFEKIGFESV